MSVYERLFKEQGRLRKQFDLLNEKLEYLGKKSVIASSGSKAFELKKEKEETEDGLDEISFQLDNVEQKINKLDMSRIFNLLLDLDCHHHAERFIEFLSFQKAGAFFIHSSEKYSLRLLLKRLLQEIRFCVTEQPIVINLPSVFTRYGGIAALDNFDIAESLCYEIGRKVGLRRPSPEQIAQRLAKKRKTQNVILVLEEVDFRYDLNEIVGKFWSDL